MVQILTWVLSSSNEQLLLYLDPKPSVPVSVHFPTSMNLKSETKEQGDLNHFLADLIPRV